MKHPMRRVFASALAVLTVLAPAALRPAAASAEPHVLRFSDGLDLTTLNPLFAVSGNVALLGSLTMAYFTRFDAHNRPVPELLTEIPTLANGGISRDGLTLTFHLRHGVRWSDGAPFDANDVTYTLGAIQNPNNNVSERSAWDHVASAEARGPYTVVFRLRSRFAAFASDFFSSASTSCILPRHVLGSLATINTAPYNALPVGIGPFRYTAFRRGDAVEMEANPYYFRGKPKLEKIVYKIITDDNTLFAQLQTGELDMWAQVTGTFSARVRALRGIAVEDALSYYMAGIHLNTSRAALRDVRVRRALRLATDRAFVLRVTNQNTGVLSESVVPRISQNFDASLAQAPYDPAQAARLLDAAGWKAGPDGMRARGGVPLVLDVVLPTGYTPSAQLAELLRVMWQKVGVGVAAKAYASATFFAPLAAGGILQSGRFDAALFSNSVDPYGDVSSNFGCAYVPPRGFNYFRLCDRTADAAMNAYATTYEPKRAAALARVFQRRLDDDAAMIVTYERGFPYAFTSALTGFHPSGFGPFDDMLNVDVSR